MKKLFVSLIALLISAAVLFALLLVTNGQENPQDPTGLPTDEPTETSTQEPTDAPTEEPTQEPTEAPTEEPTQAPTEAPTEEPTQAPTKPNDTNNSSTKPAGSNTSSPTKPNNSNVVAEGKWDFGPLTWKITKDGVLTIEGNHSFQAYPEDMYIWKKYSSMIKKIVIGDGVTNIARDAFSYMTEVVSVQLGKSVKTIDYNAFCGCTSLTSVTIPQNVKTIREYAFAGCSGLRKVSFAAGCKLETIEEYAFTRSGIEEFIAPPSLRTIVGRAFYDCDNLETVRLEGGITTLEGQAFRDCNQLKTLVLGESLREVGGFAFDKCDALTVIENYCSVVRGFSNLPNLTTLVIGGNREETGTYFGCPLLTDVTILSPITKISNNAFELSQALKKVTIPKTVTTIGTKAFIYTAITEIVIPESVTEIRPFAFGYTPLEKVIFTGDVPVFENASAFLNVCATVYYPANNSTWTEEARQNYGGSLTWVAQ